MYVAAGCTGTVACACVCVLNGIFDTGCTGVLEVSMPALPPLANCPTRKGVASKLPPEAFRWRGG